MCWQCIDEEALFREVGLSIIDREYTLDAYPIIHLRAQDGTLFITNPNADWLFANKTNIFACDADGEKYLLPEPTRRSS